jgi:hypothetical protein
VLANLHFIGYGQVFVVECHNPDQPIADLGRLMVSFIEDEKDNDLLDVRSSTKFIIRWANVDCLGDLET